MASGAAGIVILNEFGQVLLVRLTYKGSLWSLPGGMIEEGESAWAAAVRECREELQIVVKDPVLAGLYFRPHRNDYVYIFRATTFDGAPTPDGVEIDKWGYFPIDELPMPVTSFTVERIRDAAKANGVALKEQLRSTYQIFE